MTKTKYIFIFISLMMLSACAFSSGRIPPEIHLKAFPGFHFKQGKVGNAPKLTGYQYQSAKGGVIDIHSCSQAQQLNINLLPEYEYYRFQGLLLSCRAISIYSKFGATKNRYFPTVLGKKFFEQLPAVVSPLLNKKDLERHKNKTFSQYYKNVKIKLVNAYSATLLTPDDEIDITVLARGDYNHDGIEDLLIESDWSARHAYGEYSDLLVIGKNAKNKPIHVIWRMKPVK